MTAAPAQRDSYLDLRIRTRDGCNLVARRFGVATKDAPRVALVHSLAMDRSFWTAVVDALAAEVSLLVYDCRGHGASDKTAGPYALRQFADDLADLLDHVGWRSATLAGASMGGCVALSFAAANPARSEALGLIDTTSWYGADAPRQWAERADRAKAGGMRALVEFQTQRWFGDAFRAARPDIVAAAVATFLNNDVRAYAATCEMLGAVDLRAALANIAAPTAIVVGAEDYATPLAMAEAMQRGIRGAELIVLNGARHFTPLERPDEIAGALRGLLRRTGAGGRRP